MLETKVFEIRDACTFVPVMAIRGIPAKMDEPAKYLIKRAGWNEDRYFVYLISLNDCRCQYDPNKWNGCRTLGNAHNYILRNWDELSDGDVIDIQYILKETPTPKKSERIEFGF